MLDPKAKQLALSMTRRHFFRRSTAGIALGIPALASLLSQDGFAVDGGIDPKTGGQMGFPNFAPKAKRIIFLHQSGAPSQIDLFDPKPSLAKWKGTDLPDSVRMGQRITGMTSGQSTLPVAPSIFNFSPVGESGTHLSELLPHHAKIVDHIAMIRTVYTDAINHDPAITFIQTGFQQPGRPSMGSWVSYGLGSENQNLPAYVVLDDPLGLPINGVENWQAGFLPPTFQGTRFRSTGSPVLNLRPDAARPTGVATAERELLARLDNLHRGARPSQPNLDARIDSYALAGRMQLAATDALDISGESAATREMYGVGRAPTDSYGRRCLIARRLVERGVRFVQLYINAQIWDNHTTLAADLKAACDRTDQPIAALLRDLKQRGLFDTTLVVWGGEFGRLPIAQLPADRDERKAGRDHNKNAFCTWMAGAGVRGGTTYGATDDLGMAAVEDRVSVPDWHATILHLLGMRYEQLYFETDGLRERLTGVDVNETHVVRGILA
jgi:Protein of unknown function (DUF1501)